jgi:hypothetical protein
MKLQIAILTVTLTPAEPALTIYNQNFAVVRDTVPLELKAGINDVRFAGTTAHVEPDSVILRDPSGRQMLQILEQNYRGDPISEQLLLSLNEGKVIEFEATRQLSGGETKREIIQGKIIRSGYVPHEAAYGRYGAAYAMQQRAIGYSGGTAQPIIEVTANCVSVCRDSRFSRVLEMTPSSSRHYFGFSSQTGPLRSMRS